MIFDVMSSSKLHKILMKMLHTNPSSVIRLLMCIGKKNCLIEEKSLEDKEKLWVTELQLCYVILVTIKIWF